jgi:hypothetical protein
MEAFGYAGWVPRWLNVFGSVSQSCAGMGELPVKRLAWAKLGQGILLAVPFLFVFGCLFLAADANYARQLEHWLGEVGLQLGPVLRTLLFSVLLLGVLRYYTERASAGELPRLPWQADPTVVGVALGCLNLLFASFLLSQAAYLFGQAHLTEPNFTLAEYARRGFFELTAATLLVLGLVLACYATLHRQQRAGRALALLALLIVQTFGLAGSAVHRMGLYIQGYGLTLTRSYVELTLLGICLTLLLTLAALTFRPELPWLTSRLLLLGLVMLALVSLVDVERLVAEVNVARARAGAPVDLAYLGTLSADALPALQGLPAEAQIRARLEPLGWQSFNFSRLQAQIQR